MKNPRRTAFSPGKCWSNGGAGRKEGGAGVDRGQARRRDRPCSSRTRYSGQRDAHRARHLSAVWSTHSIGTKREIGCRGPVAPGGRKRRQIGERDKLCIQGYGRRLAILPIARSSSAWLCCGLRRGAAASEGIGACKIRTRPLDAGPPAKRSRTYRRNRPGETVRPGTPPCKSRAPALSPAKLGSPYTTYGREPAAQTGQRTAPGGRASCDRRLPAMAAPRSPRRSRAFCASKASRLSSAAARPISTVDGGGVSIAPAGSGKQHIKIVARPRRRRRRNRHRRPGKRCSERLLPRAWGDVAYVVALAAGEGLVQVLARAGPPATPAAATGPEAVPSAEKAAAAKNPEAAAPSKTAKTKRR